MNHFIHNIIRRHLQTENNIIPRVPGRFETFNANRQDLNEMNFIESEAFKTMGNNEIRKSNEPPDEGRDVKEKGNTFDSDTNAIVYNKNSERAQFLIPNATFTNLNEVSISAEDRIKTSDDQNSTTDNTAKVANIFSNSKSDLTDIKPDFFVINRRVTLSEKENPDKKKFKWHKALLAPQKEQEAVNKQPLFFENTEQTQNIKISIGRIDVRAVVSPSGKKETPPQQKPNMSLDDYLKKRNGTK
jgi:hypothetical protein